MAVTVNNLSDLEYADVPANDTPDSTTIGTMTIETGDSGGKTTGDR